MKRSSTVFLIYFLILGKLSTLANLGFAKERPEVTGTMREVFNALMNLQPFAVNAERFRDPKNKQGIQKDLRTLSRIDHSFPKKMTEEEPGLAAIAKLFGEYVHDVQGRYKTGDFEYARHRVRSVTAFCFGCHSRLSTEKNFQDFQRRVENGNFTLFEKAEIYSATRQFDKALKTYQELFDSSPKNEMGVIEFTRGLRHALSVTVRVKRDPKATVELLQGVSKRKNMPEFVLGFIAQWKKDADAWAAEKEGGKLVGEALVAKAKGLIEHASSLQNFPADENGDISYLRASSYLHEALEESPKANFRAEALYLLGTCYYALQDPMLWDLDRIYFESCVREAPHTEIGRKCYRRYSDKIYLGYSGSGGTFIPEDELKKLVELRKISQ